MTGSWRRSFRVRVRSSPEDEFVAPEAIRGLDPDELESGPSMELDDVAWLRHLEREATEPVDPVVNG